MVGKQNTKEYGSQSMVKPLKRVLVRAPDKYFFEADPLKWNYLSSPNPVKAQEEHKKFVSTLESQGVEVLYHNEDCPGLADAIFVHDPVIVCDKGAIILKMGKDLRRGEEEAIEKCLEALKVPIFYKLHGRARAEGGDLLWLDEKTLLVGQGYRTNKEGLEQLGEALAPLEVELIPVDLPTGRKTEACMHFQSLISLVDDAVAVVYRPFLAANVLSQLQSRGYTLIEVPEEEYLTLASNILTIRPGLVLTLQGNPRTKKKMEDMGIVVLTYIGNEISLKAEGGATCLTRPLLRG